MKELLLNILNTLFDLFSKQFTKKHEIDLNSSPHSEVDYSNLLHQKFIEKIENDWEDLWLKDHGVYVPLTSLSQGHQLYKDLEEDICLKAEDKLFEEEELKTQIQTISIEEQKKIIRIKVAERIKKEGLTISNVTLYRFVKKTTKPSIKTLDLICIYLENKTYKDFVAQHAIRYSANKLNWLNIFFAFFTLGIGFGAGFLFKKHHSDDHAKLVVNSNFNFDGHGKDAANILFAVQLVGLVELNAYRALPEIDSSWLDLCYTADCPSRKRITNNLLERSQNRFTKGNKGNTSNFKVYDFKIIKQTPDSAIVETLESWNLTYFDMVNQRYEKTYNETDCQLHYLVKKNGGWKVHLVKRIKDGQITGDAL